MGPLTVPSSVTSEIFSVSVAASFTQSRPLRSGLLVWLGLAMMAGGLAAAAAGIQHRVSQKGRAFTPNTLDMKKGESVEFFNDDGELLHHAYLESSSFSFDTGDQEPGSRSVILFPKSGTFTVLCGIHPKMKLTVRVQ